eukprot:scaffold2482_cov131-Isochrysis_galbana.AAC.6
MTIRPELTVTPYQATSRHRSASVGLGGQRRQGIFFLPSGARGGSCVQIFVGGHFVVCGRSTSYPTSLLPAAAGVRSTTPPAGKEGPGSGSEWKNGAKCPAVGTSFKELILPPYHRATSVLQRSICTTRPGSSIRKASGRLPVCAEPVGPGALAFGHAY